ncbi:hypothetical protein FSP39_019722 [Pinctada imbricata]|uniref:VWFA domain-containing protein n=1 Tax=Pinctada imbricata TaxID=66713 RepID=A0AA88YGT5_PINIB|nr:hypothetical protein FSP39_019722 [Pinctada imbricata]
MTAKDYILDGALNGTWMGIVEFNSKARILQNITKISSKSVRRELTRTLPTTARGRTSIGAGLLKGYQMIRDHGSVVAGARIMLVTDGKENEEPKMNDVCPILVSHEIVIDDVMVTDEADPNIEKMSSDTGGKSYFYTGFNNPTVMDTAFDSLVPDDELSVQIHTSAISIRKGEMENVSFYIDKSINRDLKIRLSLLGKNASVNILIRMPSGKTKQFQDRFSDMHTACIPLKGNNEPGEYLIKLSTNSSQNSSGEILITSKKREESFTLRRKREASMRESFDVVGWLSKNTFNLSEMQKISVHASVSMAYAPIIYGNVSAWIEDGRGKMFHLQMKDDGIGSDSEAKDGVYSASILAPRIMANGRHSVKIKASNLKAEAKILVRDRGRSSKGFKMFSSGALSTGPRKIRLLKNLKCFAEHFLLICGQISLHMSILKEISSYWDGEES